MTKPSPVPDEVSKPFWDACNQRKLVIQNCTTCNRMQHPPQRTCAKCGSADHLAWRAMSGKGKIHGYCVSHDSRVILLQEIQPFNLAVVALDDDPDIKMLSHLPGTPEDQVPVGAPVEVTWEATYNGQMTYEWQVVTPPQARPRTRAR